jgi:nucleotide-binding universal stress UspA family protein
MKHILLAIDRGAASWEAARLAIHIAPRLKLPITVLSVVVPGPRRKEVKDQRQREYEAVRELVDDVVRELVTAGVKAKGDVRSSKPGDVDREILASATRIGADLIVMGSRARSELTGVLFGSASQEVARGADCPVVIVPTGAMAKVSPKRIVLAIDSRGDPDRPVATTIELAQALKAAVDLVCVGRAVPTPVGSVAPGAGPTPDQEVVGKALIALQEAGILVQARMIPDHRGLAPEVAQEAIATGADLVVIGTRALGWTGGDIAAGTAAAVARRTRRPVVVAPARRATGHSKVATKDGAS